MTVDELEHIAVWASWLSADECEKAAAGIRLKQFDRGQHIAHLADKVDAWHGVVSGILRVGMVSDTGQVTGMSAILGGGWFGEGSILKDEPRRYDVMAVADCELAIMRGDTFRWLYKNSAGFNRFLVTQMNERLGQLIATVGKDRASNATGRLASTIASLYNPVLFPKTPNPLAILQEDLGVFAGLSRQMTNKALKQLAEEGLVSLLPGALHVADLDGLKSYGD